MLKITTKAFAACLAIVLFAGCTATPMYRPNPIVVPKSVSTAERRQAVVSALKDRGWTIEKNWKERTEASVRRRTHVARIRVTYPGNQVKIDYLNSQDLKYAVENGEEFIHRRYNHWVRLLEDEILARLSSKGAYSVVSTDKGMPSNKSSKPSLVSAKQTGQSPVMREGAVVEPDNDYY